MNRGVQLVSKRKAASETSRKKLTASVSNETTMPMVVRIEISPIPSRILGMTASSHERFDRFHSAACDDRNASPMGVD